MPDLIELNIKVEIEAARFHRTVFMITILLLWMQVKACLQRTWTRCYLKAW